MIEKSAHILIVEDDEDDYILVKDYLEDLDEYRFEIDWVSNPSDALKLLKLNQHDICLLDYQLGAQTGLTVLNKATDMQCRVPIIMLTGQSDKILDKAALDSGAVDFIVKTDLDGPRFARSIRYAIARQEVEKERLERINIETKSRSKDRFLAHLSHELRTPLTSILGYTELLLASDRANQVTPELNIILNNSRHLLCLLNDVLDLSKIAANKLEIAPSNINLNSFLVDIYTVMQVSAEDKGIELELTSSTQLPETIFCDPTRLRQILINLIHNGIKFTDNGKVSIAIKALLANDQWTLSFDITDTGQGIPVDKVKKIFQPFEQVDDMVTKKETGAGLGLAISAELATKLGGRIDVESTIGKGSCFTFTILCNNIKDTKLYNLSLEKNAQTEQYKILKPLIGRILVVDDVADIRMLIGHIVKTFGLEVDFAENGQQACEKTMKSMEIGTPYHVILMDIHMPKMNGNEAVVKIRELGFTERIIALTAATMKGVKENLQTLGFDDVISKPVDKALLHKCLSTNLDFNMTQTSLPSSLPHNGDITEQNKQHFLLVEDDIDAAGITKLLLESMGVDVQVAHSGHACRQLLQTRPQWDKVLLDVHLPDESGLVLAKYIASNVTVREIVIVSGAEIDKADIKNSGSNRALMKPLNKQKLFDLVH
jgi:signal transduction histidine kinase/BarA-like signal transduction histidine kinase